MPAPECLIKLIGVGKDYPRVANSSDRLKSLWVTLQGHTALSSHRILDVINLEVKKGESLGLIGVNGAGKSTLLKTIAGVITPTSGTVEVNGKLGALLELGAGFHPEYTGMENVKLSAALLGMNAGELYRKLPEIVAFADIGDYINEPIKHYSSGMVVRLGFAILTAANPDLLITDEVLAVGDESFQKKCIRWIENYLATGGTLLLCSHSMFHIQKLCSKALWLHEGRVYRYGDAFEVTQEYLAWHEQRSAPDATSGSLTLGAGGEYNVQELSIETDTEDNLNVIKTGASLTLNGAVKSSDGRAPVVCIGVMRAPDVSVYGLTSDMDGFTLRQIGSNLFEFSLKLNDLPLLPGQYSVRAHAMDPEGMRLYDTVERTFAVSGSTRELGFCRLAHSWE